LYSRSIYQSLIIPFWIGDLCPKLAESEFCSRRINLIHLLIGQLPRRCVEIELFLLALRVPAGSDRKGILLQRPFQQNLSSIHLFWGKPEPEFCLPSWQFSQLPDSRDHRPWLSMAPTAHTPREEYRSFRDMRAISVAASTGGTRFD
jgi:hypothetical protein